MSNLERALGCSGRGVIVAAILLALTPLAQAEVLPVPAAMQAKIDKAIDDGVVYLKTTAGPWGTWASDKTHMVGYAALPGLTLLECGVSPQNQHVQNAATLVRMAGPKLDTTYEISLSILFLDKLGEAKDKSLIQLLALRLIAGQTPTGGWPYKCPILTQADHKQLLGILKNLDNPVLYNPSGGVNLPMANAAPSNGNLPLGNMAIAKDPQYGTGQAPTVDDKPAVSTFAPLGSRRWAWCIKSDDAGATDTPGANKRPKIIVPANLRGMPVLYPPPGAAMDPKDKGHQPIWGTTDNSNTQFAILALWAARKHQVPTARSFNLVARRFYTSQNPDGTWGYHHRVGGDPDVRPSMTCVGLLGLAVAHGLAHDLEGKMMQGNDAWVVNGLLALSKTIGEPVGRTENVPMGNLYFLWSVERVGVLYNLPRIGNKDWYRWGAEILVSNQKKPGNWEEGKYHGSSPPIDTCLALLFLKRANLLGDLAKVLPFKPADLARDVAMRIPLDPRTQEAGEKSAPVKEVAKGVTPAEDVAETPVPAQTITPLAKPLAGADTEETPSRAWMWLLGMLVLLIGGGVGLVLLARTYEEEERPRTAKRPRKPSELRGSHQT